MRGVSSVRWFLLGKMARIFICSSDGIFRRWTCSVEQPHHPLRSIFLHISSDSAVVFRKRGVARSIPLPASNVFPVADGSSSAIQRVFCWSRQPQCRLQNSATTMLTSSVCKLASFFLFCFKMCSFFLPWNERMHYCRFIYNCTLLNVLQWITPIDLFLKGMDRDLVESLVRAIL